MPYQFSKLSLEKLKGVHPSLVKIIHAVMKLNIMDFSVVEGLRTEERQKQLFQSGATKTMNSMHIIQPDGWGHAVDLYPSPINMAKVNAKDPVEISRFGVLAGIMLTVAKESGIGLTWGGDFDGNGQTLDNSFFDAVHFELKQKK